MKRYQKNQYEESKEENKKDKEFFERAYKFFKHTDGWMHCLECGIPIKNERWSIHHILPKSIYPDLRYEIANVVPLCRSHHSEAESSISYLKMKKYSTLEQMKRMLLDNYGINNKTT
jgi:5-methylcytosine-specific restriction endonuclease McrA